MEKKPLRVLMIKNQNDKPHINNGSNSFIQWYLRLAVMLDYAWNQNPRLTRV